MVSASSGISPSLPSLALSLARSLTIYRNGSFPHPSIHPAFKLAIIPVISISISISIPTHPFFIYHPSSLFLRFLFPHTNPFQPLITITTGIISRHPSQESRTRIQDMPVQREIVRRVRVYTCVCYVKRGEGLGS